MPPIRPPRAGCILRLLFFVCSDYKYIWFWVLKIIFCWLILGENRNLHSIAAVFVRIMAYKLSESICASMPTKQLTSYYNFGRTKFNMENKIVHHLFICNKKVKCTTWTTIIVITINNVLENKFIHVYFLFPLDGHMFTLSSLLGSIHLLSPLHYFSYTIIYSFPTILLPLSFEWDPRNEGAFVMSISEAGMVNITIALGSFRVLTPLFIELYIELSPC